MNIGMLYGQVCEVYRRERNDATGEAWKNVLSKFPLADVRSAIREWQENTRIDQFTGKPVGASMPSPADIAVICERLARKKIAGNKFEPCGHCESGWVRITLFHPKLQKDYEAVTACQCRKEWIESARMAAK